MIDIETLASRLLTAMQYHTANTSMVVRDNAIFINAEEPDKNDGSVPRSVELTLQVRNR
jgi:hypothetical protein